jgi:hypothetical protein
VASLHVAVGDFPKAMELLKKQLAVENFEPLRQLFIDVFTLNKMKIQTLPHISPLDYTLRNANSQPLVVVNLNALNNKYTSGIELTTKGEFA